MLARGVRAGRRRTPRSRLTATAWAWPIATARSSTRARCARCGDLGNVRADPRRFGGDRPPPRRDSQVAPGAPAAGHALCRQRLSQPVGEPVGRRRSSTAWGSRGPGSVAPSSARSTPTSSSTTRTGRPPTCAALASWSIDRVRRETGIELVPRSCSLGIGRAGSRRREGSAPRMKSTSIAVLIGGPSAEHDVSLVSGRAIAAALMERGHDIQGWLIDLAGGWWRLPADSHGSASYRRRRTTILPLSARGSARSTRCASRDSAGQNPQPVAFIALHGPFGEDGTVQALCELAGLVYTGAGVAASAIGMDKVIFKRLTGAMGMPSRAMGRPVGARNGRRIRQAPSAASPTSRPRSPTHGWSSSRRGWARQWASQSSTIRPTPSTSAVRWPRRSATATRCWSRHTWTMRGSSR